MKMKTTMLLKLSLLLLAFAGILEARRFTMKANRCIERDTIYAGVLNDAELQIDDFWVLGDAF